MKRKFINAIKRKKKLKQQQPKRKKDPTKRPIKIFTLDTETRGLDGHVFRIGLYDGKAYFVKNNFRELLPIITHFSKNFDCHIYVHNLEFDIKKGADYLMGKSDLTNTRFINSNAAIFKTKINNVMNQHEEELDSMPITFHCSYHLIPRSLENISKSFGLDKDGKMNLEPILKEDGWAVYDENGNFDYEESKENYFCSVDPLDKKLNEYLKLDCTSLYSIVTTLIDLSGLPVYDFIKCPTVASLSLKIYKTLFPEDYATAISGRQYGVENQFKEDFLRAAYNGGRTEVFKNYGENIFYYDVNSLYPYIMKNFKMPVGDSVFYTDHDRIEEKLIHNDELGLEGIGFVECDIFVPDDLHIPVLPTVYRGKLCFLTGNIRGVWSHKELLKALEVGCEVNKYHQMLFFEKTTKIFQKFVETFEKLKNEDDDANSAKREYAKLILNSLYGKFGMRREFVTLFNVEDEDKVIKKVGNEYSRIYNPHYDKEMLLAITPAHAEYIRVHISAYITSMARLVLYEAMEVIMEAGGNIYYCDTDSIVCDVELPAEMVDLKEFGKWKREYAAFPENEFIAIAPKNYSIKFDENNVIKKQKGTPKKYLNKLTFDDYKSMLEKKKTGEETYIKIGEVKQFTKSKTSLKNKLPMNTMKVIEKGVHLDRMQKRIFDLEENTSKPVKVNFWGEGAKDLPDIEYYKVDPTKQYRIQELQFYEENDLLLEYVLKLGKIKIPGKNEPYYEEIKTMDPSIKEKYFSRNKNNLTLEEFVQGIDNISVIGIMEELTARDMDLKEFKETGRLEIS